jgi:hypothetical protein
MTESRSIRYALAFMLSGLSSIMFGMNVGLAGAPLIWFGANFMAIGANYAFPRHFGVFRKKNGQISLPRKVLLLPYLTLLHVTWHLLRKTSSDAPFAELTPGIFIGRRLLPTEYPPIATVVDLTSEFDEHVPDGAHLIAFPILDGAPTEPCTLREMAEKIGASVMPIYIHCAQGYGRTSMVSAAVLLELRAAPNVASALDMIRKVRPGAMPNAAQRQALMAAFPNVG